MSTVSETPLILEPCVLSGNIQTVVDRVRHHVFNSVDNISPNTAYPTQYDVSAVHPTGFHGFSMLLPRH